MVSARDRDTTVTLTFDERVIGTYARRDGQRYVMYRDIIYI